MSEMAEERRLAAVPVAEICDNRRPIRESETTTSAPSQARGEE